jgi:hypothetical protein
LNATETRKYFFFEKKKQKTFVCCVRHWVQLMKRMLSETGKGFLVLFFKKELLSFRSTQVGMK